MLMIENTDTITGKTNENIWQEIRACNGDTWSSKNVILKNCIQKQGACYLQVKAWAASETEVNVSQFKIGAFHWIKAITHE